MYYGNRQGGSAATFIVVGLLLVAVAAGVLYGARQYMASQRTAPISEESMQTTPADEQPGQSNDVAQDEQSSNEQQKTPESDSAENKQTSEDPSRDTETESTTDINTEQSARGNDHETPLPQTGPTESVFAALVVGIATASAIAYVRSQRLI